VTRSLTIGIDEVGRGALAGPVVVVTAAIIGTPSQIANHSGRRTFSSGSGLGKLKDSKRLSARQREDWYAYFCAHPTKIVFAAARVYPRQIEKRNISAAANLAARRAYERLVEKMKMDTKKNGNVKIFLDGGLYLQTKVWQLANVPRAKTIIKADEKFAVVSIASIIAKVHRDDFMRRVAAKKYPAYGFEIHKGYGTAAHRAAIEKHGPCEIHRLTFLSKSPTIY